MNPLCSCSRNAQIKRSDGKISSDKNAKVDKIAQEINAQFDKMLRNKCSAAKKCSDEMLRLAQDPPEHE